MHAKKIVLGMLLGGPMPHPTAYVLTVQGIKLGMEQGPVEVFLRFFLPGL